MLELLKKRIKLSFLSKNVKCLVFIFFCYNDASLARQNLPEEIKDHLAALSTATFIEPAHSMGSLGFSIGLSRQQFIEKSKIQDRKPSLLSSLDPSLETASLQTVHVAKGFSYPINMGLAVGQLRERPVYSYTAQVQWTVFEGFRLPSIALRAAAGQLRGIPSLRKETLQLGAFADYSVMRFLTPYIGYQQSLHYVSLNHQDEHLLRLAESYKNGSGNFAPQQSWRNLDKIAGAKLRLPTYFLQLVGEVHVHDTYTTLWLKIGLGT